MVRLADPYRVLDVPRDASLEEVKAAYRRLAKRYHPDSAGPAALPRFLAIQAAYESLTEGAARLRLGGGRTRPPARARRGDDEGVGARGRRPGEEPADGPGPAERRSRTGTTGGSRPRDAGPSSSDHASGRDPGRPRRSRRAPGATSYDGVEAEPFEPEWEGASWYGGSSGTYWTLNPKEFADPRKHGPDYLARGRRVRERRARSQARAEAPEGRNASSNEPGSARSAWRADPPAEPTAADPATAETIDRTTIDRTTIDPAAQHPAPDLRERPGLPGMRHGVSAVTIAVLAGGLLIATIAAAGLLSAAEPSAAVVVALAASAVLLGRTVRGSGR